MARIYSTEASPLRESLSHAATPMTTTELSMLHRRRLMARMYSTEASALRE